MALKAKPTTSGSFDVPEAGSQPARLVAIVDLGTHREDRYDKSGQEDVHKVYLAWELVEEPRKDGKGGVVVGKDFRFSLNDKAALKLFLDKWLGTLDPTREFDFPALLGTACILGIDHKKVGEKTYVNVVSAAKPVKGMVVKPPTYGPFEWDQDGDLHEVTEWKDGRPVLKVTGEEDYPNPDWLPRLYGGTIDDWVATAKEQGGAGQRPQKEANGNGGQPQRRQPAPAGASWDDNPLGGDNEDPFPPVAGEDGGDIPY